MPVAAPLAAPPRDAVKTRVAKPSTTAAAPAADAERTAGAVDGGDAVLARALARLKPAERAQLALQVRLDRARFGPGSIDARRGTNVEHAAAAWRAANDGFGGDIAAELAARDGAPVLATHSIGADEVEGPFEPATKDMEALAKRKEVGFASPIEALGERFHAAPALLTRLNPGVDFGKAGTVIVVPAVGRALEAKVARIEVDKVREQLRAFGGDGKIVAVFPATVGSAERPAPAGAWEVRAVAPKPSYTFDPKRLTFGKKTLGKLTIAAGPNNPVGSTWIDLTKDTYGIHGTPDPELVGKRASHGCVRLTNWDAAALGAVVSKGTKVVFVGSEKRAG